MEISNHISYEQSHEKENGKKNNFWKQFRKSVKASSQWHAELGMLGDKNTESLKQHRELGKSSEIWGINSEK